MGNCGGKDIQKMEVYHGSGKINDSVCITTEDFLLENMKDEDYAKEPLDTPGSEGDNKMIEVPRPFEREPEKDIQKWTSINRIPENVILLGNMEEEDYEKEPLDTPGSEGDNKMIEGPRPVEREPERVQEMNQQGKFLRDDETVIEEICSRQNTSEIQPSSIKAECLRLIYEQGTKSEELLSHLRCICSKANDQFKTQVNQILPVYEFGKSNEPILLAIVDNIDPDLQSFESFTIIQRKYGDVSEEAKKAFELEKIQTFTSEEKDKLKKCLTKHSQSLMQKHTNLLIIAPSKYKCKNYDQQNWLPMNQMCVVLYVHVKGMIPFGEDPFPNELEGISVDVRESLFRFHASPKDFMAKLMMGCYFETGNKTGGTLGGFVKLENGKIGCITAGHIFSTEIGQHNFSIDVYQPNINPSYKFGEDIQHSFGERYDEITVDAALIKITNTNRYPISGRFPDAEAPETGFSPQNPMVFNSGEIIKGFEDLPMSCNVVKYGAATEHTIGHLNLNSVTVRGLSHVIQDEVFFGQIWVTPLKDLPFASRGDSGSLVFAITDAQLNTSGRIRALGMYIGAFDHGGAVVTPIWAILHKLNLPFQLLSFSEQQDHDYQESLLKEMRNLGNKMDQIETEVTDIKKRIVKIEEVIRTESTLHASRRVQSHLPSDNFRFGIKL